MKKLYLSRNDKKIAGLCGGIAEMLDIDPSLVRLAFVFLTIATWLVPVVITYLVGWIVTPEEPQPPEHQPQ